MVDNEVEIRSAVLELRWYTAERISISLSTTTASLTYLLLDDLCACLRFLLDDVGTGCIAAKLRCRVRKVAATNPTKIGQNQVSVDYSLT